MDEPEQYAGQRLSFEGHRCTVRFIGPIPGTEGVWLGVEWDEDARGKHDGSYKGHRYFQCQSTSPSAASFVRPTRPRDQPLSFLQALKRKYIPHSAENEIVRISGKTVEEVGFQKIQQHLNQVQDLETIALTATCLEVKSSTYERQASEIQSLNLKVRHLDLSWNLLESWADVVAICRHLNALKTICLTGNQLANTHLPRETSSGDTKSAFDIPAQISELSLDATFLSWEQASFIAAGFDHLEKLTLGSNDIKDTSVSHLNAPFLTELDLSYNRISSIDQISSLTNIPNLKVLSLRGNPLQNLQTSNNTSFRTLNTLDLAESHLLDLVSLNPFHKLFPSVSKLLISETPLSKVSSASLLIIARLKTITWLNHSSISAEERQNAELFYLNKIAKQLETASNPEQESALLQDHPRWDELCSIYGKPKIEAQLDNAINPDTLQARLAVFTFYISNPVPKTPRKKSTNSNTQSPSISVEPSQRSPDTPANPLPKSINYPQPSPHPTTEKSLPLPLTTSIYALKGIVGRLFALPAPFSTSIRLVHETDEWDVTPASDLGGSMWDVSGDGDESAEGAEGDGRGQGEEGGDSGKRVRREVELVGGTKRVGDYVAERRARVRVEVLGEGDMEERRE